MSEKRLDYDLLWNNYYQVIELDDGDTDYLRRLSPTEIIKRLNKQQALINALKKENKELKEELKKGFDVPIPYVENSMRRLRAEHKVDEQQATIKELEEEIKLLKPTNIEQYEQIQKLQEENDKLRKELGDCEKFRYTVFKRLNEEYKKECSIR